MSGSLLYGNNRTVGFASSDREVSSFFKGVSYCFIIMKHLFLYGETLVSLGGNKTPSESNRRGFVC